MTSRNCIECSKINIKKRASFNLPTEIKAKYCKNHKTDEMVNVNQKKCQEDGCGKTPAFNYEGETVGKYCSGHSKEGMINIAHRNGKCKEKGCPITYPIFNYKGEKKGIYCRKHCLEGMIDVKNPSCEIDGCEHQPRFNLPSIKKGRFCEEHKHEGMINVMSEQCENKECDKRPSYNYLGEKKGRFCMEHCLENMVDVVSTRCKTVDCNKQPCYNYPEYKFGLYCATHSLTGMINVTGIKCLSEGCFSQPYMYNKDKYKGYCTYCFIHLFPNEPVSRNYKTKEKTVVDFVKKEFPNWTYICDKKITDGCSQRRPDICVDFGQYVLIIEIDENQHQDYSCENKRIMELSQDIGHRPMILIRFNPDEYILHGKKIQSCWKLNKLGLCVVKDNKQKEWMNRLNVLKNTIDMSSQKGTDKTVDIINLFYDI
jgi:hypothetical protein